MAAALQVHDGIVRDAIERHDGYVFTTVTDGFGAAFARAGDAASAAIEAQQRLTGAALPFAIRMGLHTGEATERDGSYVGSSVSRAARLTSLAHGGQVVASDTTEVMLRDRVAVRPLGEHRLRGLRGRTAVFQVIAEGLRVDFPVLRSVDRSTGNLPQQLNSFVGREDLVAEVVDLVRSNRLVTLSGVGGCRQDQARGRGGCRARGRASRRGVDGRARARGRALVGAGGHRDRARHHPAGRRRVDRHRCRGARRPAAAAGRRQLRARVECGGVGRQRDPRPIRQRQRPRHVTRVPVGRGRDAPVGLSTRARGWCRVRCGHVVRRPRRARCGPTSGFRMPRRPRP